MDMCSCMWRKGNFSTVSFSYFLVNLLFSELPSESLFLCVPKGPPFLSIIKTQHY